MGEERDRRRYWSEIRLLAAFFIVPLVVVASGVLLGVFGPRWATEQVGSGPRAGSLAEYLVLVGVIPLIIAIGGIVRRLIKGPTPPGRHSADLD
ncbi:MAG TPA: hypothetical protein VJ872_13835 [Nocardioides sp.]|nr:hypothetical protein [Nocardioides sp.]